MFQQVAIIGVGLMGGSLALAMKERKLADQIIGVSRNADTLTRAKKLGIIDTIPKDLAHAVQGSDLVVLATPLSTYATLAKQISPHLKTDAVLTDVGSVKHQASLDVLGSLQPFQHSQFVPAHPIAGTEHSGPEAAFSTLYEGRIVLITPHDKLDGFYADRVAHLWEEVGAHVETMDIAHHDQLYARVSHNVQWLSSCFGLLLKALPPVLFSEITKNADINFQKFIRLTGSDSVMWRDIFIINRANIIPSIQEFCSQLQSLKSLLTHHKTSEIAERMRVARQKRLKFHEVFKGRKDTNFRESFYGGLSTEARVYMDYLPRCIGTAIMEIVEEGEYTYAAGAGFHGVTKNIILDGADDIAEFSSHTTLLSGAIQDYIEILSSFITLVQKSDSDGLNTKLDVSRSVYQEIKNP